MNPYSWDPSPCPAPIDCRDPHPDKPQPYAASSFLSVAIARVLGTALNARCAKRPELVGKPLDLEARLPVIQAPDGLLEKLFVPLGYPKACSPTPCATAITASNGAAPNSAPGPSASPLHMTIM